MLFKHAWHFNRPTRRRVSEADEIYNSALEEAKVFEFNNGTNQSREQPDVELASVKLAHLLTSTFASSLTLTARETTRLQSKNVKTNVHTVGESHFVCKELLLLRLLIHMGSNERAGTNIRVETILARFWK